MKTTQRRGTMRTNLLISILLLTACAPIIPVPTEGPRIDVVADTDDITWAKLESLRAPPGMRRVFYVDTFNQLILKPTKAEADDVMARMDGYSARLFILSDVRRVFAAQMKLIEASPYWRSEVAAMRGVFTDAVRRWMLDQAGHSSDPAIAKIKVDYFFQRLDEFFGGRK